MNRRIRGAHNRDLHMALLWYGLEHYRRRERIVSPEQVEKVHNLLRELLVARTEKATQRKIVEDSTKAFNLATKAADRAVVEIGKATSVKKGQDLHFEVDGVTWHVEYEGGRVRVEQVKAQ